jgi:hypothetical protein
MRWDPKGAGMTAVSEPVVVALTKPYIETHPSGSSSGFSCQSSLNLIPKPTGVATRAATARPCGIVTNEYLLLRTQEITIPVAAVAGMVLWARLGRVGP